MLEIHHFKVHDMIILVKKGLISMMFFSGMPADEILYASDLIDVLKKKHDSNTFKSMVCVAHSGTYSGDITF